MQEDKLWRVPLPAIPEIAVLLLVVSILAGDKKLPERGVVREKG